MRWAVVITAVIAFALGVTTGWMLHSTPITAVAPREEKPDDDYQALLRQRRDMAQALYRERHETYANGVRGVSERLVQAAAERLLIAELALAGNPNDEVAAYERFRDAMVKLLRTAREKLDKGLIAESDPISESAFFVRDAEVRLMEARRRATGR